MGYTDSQQDSSKEICTKTCTNLQQTQKESKMVVEDGAH
jgi:hypothetical protein